MGQNITSQNKSSEKVLHNREKLFQLFKNRPMADDELLVNLALYMRSGSLARLLFLNELYQKIVDIPGVIFEFGVWMGQSLVLFENLRAVYEPYNASRRVVGFDTFSGYPEVGKEDVRSEIISEGVYTVKEGYETYLAELLDYHENENVMSHIKKHELVKGDASKSCQEYLERHKEILVALAYFDMALYEPTKRCLEALVPRLVKGSVLAFDELCHPDYPGETKAVLETFDLAKCTIQRSRFLPDRSFLIVG
jgi:hypothetical protein